MCGSLGRRSRATEPRKNNEELSIEGIFPTCGKLSGAELPGDRPHGGVDPGDGRQDLRGLGAFAFLGFGDEDANPVQWSFAGGLSGRGLIPGRCNDTCGVGYFYNGLGDPIARTGFGRLLNDEVQGLEAYYQVAPTGSVGLTVDFQGLETRPCAVLGTDWAGGSRLPIGRTRCALPRSLHDPGVAPLGCSCPYVLPS